MRTQLAFFLLCLAAKAEAERLWLNGFWRFAPDYLNWGEAYRWYAGEYSDRDWDTVETPHSWSLDPRYPYYVGAAWYRKSFQVPRQWRDLWVRVVFQGVFYRARVWLNGRLLGEHEGGYTPFEFDVSDRLHFEGPNLLVVRADNRWDENTLPGARPGSRPRDQVYPWLDHGGIIRDAWLEATPRVYLVRQKIHAEPDFASGTASVGLTVWVRNTTEHSVQARLRWRIRSPDGASAPTPAELPVRLAARSTDKVMLSTRMPAARVHLWELDRPRLYESEAELDPYGSRHRTHFGIRKFQVQSGRLLLNGNPIRLAGAHRVPDHPCWGQNDPADAVARDLSLMKEAGLVFARITHYPASPAVLDWADRHGLLIVAEAGNWGLVPAQLDAPILREKFRRQQQEMIERDWNRPSIIAWSVGNEYASDTPAGVRWTRDMAAFTRSLDPTRAVTFQSFRAWVPDIRPEDEGSHWVDFVSINVYGDPDDIARRLDRVHSRWPDKPLVISEFGIRADQVADEEHRVQWFRRVLEIVRARPFVSGLSVWSFNDYRSRYPGTNPNGYRPWGLVTPWRDLRTSYETLRQELAPARMQIETQQDAQLIVRLTPRTDFPVFPPADYELEAAFRTAEGILVHRSAHPIRLDPAGPAAVIRLPVPGQAETLEAQLLLGEFCLKRFQWSRRTPLSAR